MIYALRISSMIFVALVLIPSGAHLFEMFNKLKLGKHDYLVAQRSYDGWSLFGIVVIAALLTTLVLAIMLYKAGEPSGLVISALICLTGTQITFWIFTFPVNRITSNWTVLPYRWEGLRQQWEYSHAASALLNFAALLLLFLSALNR
jgi:hypothetical protein